MRKRSMEYASKSIEGGDNKNGYLEGTGNKDYNNKNYNNEDNYYMSAEDKIDKFEMSEELRQIIEKHIKEADDDTAEAVARSGEECGDIAHLLYEDNEESESAEIFDSDDLGKATIDVSTEWKDACEEFEGASEEKFELSEEQLKEMMDTLEGIF